MASRVSERGTITVEPDLRRQLGLRPGMIAHQRLVGDRLEVELLPAPHKRSLFGAPCQEHEPPLVVVDEEMEEAVMEAIAAEGLAG